MTSHDTSLWNDLPTFEQLLLEQQQEQQQQHQEQVQANPLLSLHAAARDGRVEIVELLLRHGASSNTCDEDGATPLHVAAHHGHARVVEQLLRHGASMDLADADGRAPLHCAVAAGNMAVVTLLLDHGARVDVENTVDGQTPLIVAAYDGNVAMVDELLGRGASMEPPNEEGLTALTAAISGSKLNVVQAILRYDVPVQTRGILGVTPLHIAAMVGHVGIVRELLHYGADFRATDTSGSTPVDYAMNDDVTQAFVDAGAIADDANNNQQQLGAAENEWKSREDSTAVKSVTCEALVAHLTTQLTCSSSISDDAVAARVMTALAQEIARVATKLTGDSDLMGQVLQTTNGLEPMDGMPPRERATADAVFKQAMLRALDERRAELADLEHAMRDLTVTTAETEASRMEDDGHSPGKTVDHTESVDKEQIQGPVETMVPQEMP